MVVSPEKVQIIEALLVLNNKEIIKQVSMLLNINYKKNHKLKGISIQSSSDLIKIIRESESSPEMTEKEFHNEFNEWKKKKEKSFSKRNS